MTSVAIERISKRYGDTVAVDDLTLAVEDGEFLVLLGPSGCGKTTTLRIIAGFIEATAGSVRIGERDVTRDPPYRRNIGLVFQNYALFPHLSVFENVAFGLRRRRVGEAELRRRVEEALALVKLEALAARMPRQLSGGQQQRVAIARAIVIEPDLLLLDEPLSNLDAKLRQEVRLELRRLQQSLKITTIMVTHDQDEAMSVGDQLAVMEHGRVRQTGSPVELYRRPADRFVASFIGRGNFFAGHATGERRFTTTSGLAIACAPLPAGVTTLLVRPENIVVAAAPSGAENELPGRIETATFLGAVLDLELALDSGDRISVEIAGRSGLDPATWPAGRRVVAQIPADCAIGIAETRR